jgi:hypothetical protein
MNTKKLLLMTMLITSMLFIFTSCGGGGGGGAVAPGVVVTTDTSTNSGDSTSVTDGTTGSGSGTIGINTGVNTGSSGSGTEQDQENYVLIILTDNNGNLNINYEKISSESYSSSTVSATDENGNTVAVSIKQDGSIQITPSDGTVEGIYTITITADGREYLLVVSVDDKNNPTVVTSISYPAGSAMILDLESGTLSANGEGIIISSGGNGNYTLDSSVSSITATDKNGNPIEVKIDPVTGDLISGSSVAVPCTIVIIMADGRVITMQTDSTGKVTGNITVAGRAVMLDLDNGFLSCGGLELTLTEHGDNGWSLAGDVQILSAVAGDGTIQVSTDRIMINTVTGDIMITGGGSAVVPAGPYEVRVSVDGKEYVIKTDASGNITGIVPGNILLDLNDGNAVHSGGNIIKLTSESEGMWSLSGRISSLQCLDSDGNLLSVSVDSATGDLRTTDSAAGEVKITFLYTDSNSNIISYTLVVMNGNIISYMAEIS